MLHYIIDGFNLVHKIPEVKRSNNQHFDIIHYIKTNNLSGSKNNPVIIVFDGYFNESVAQEREYKILYGAGKTADEVIMHQVKITKNKAQLVVVSDDREIRDFLKREGVKSMRTYEFICKSSLQPARNKSESIHDKTISYCVEREITEEMKKIWLRSKESS